MPDKTPTHAPSQVHAVATAWANSAMTACTAILADEAALRASGNYDTDEQIREFWRSRLFVDVDDTDDGPRWVVGDNYERCTNLIHYPDSGEWFTMPNYGNERRMRGGFVEALATAQIIWTG